MPLREARGGGAELRAWTVEVSPRGCDVICVVGGIRQGPCSYGRAFCSVQADFFSSPPHAIPFESLGEFTTVSIMNYSYEQVNPVTLQFTFGATGMRHAVYMCACERVGGGGGGL